jgi:predicted dehydrogenase
MNQSNTIDVPEEAVVMAAAKPRLGFLGAGWIGLNRMKAIADTGLAELLAVVEPNDEMAESALQLAPGATRFNSVADMLSADLDGVLIATPSALHAEQSIACLESGKAVFCQKPLGRDADETRRVVDAARRADRLLSVDFSYRYITGVQEMRRIITSGEIGHVFAVELVFHNAYGPDKDWFYDKRLSGGGCVIDLGVHLVDLAMWMLDYPGVEQVSATLFAGGKAVDRLSNTVEDFASAHLNLSNGSVMQMACSWRLHAGSDAVIEASFFGTNGAVSLRNIGGSFFDFTAERFSGTSRWELSEGADLNWEWGGRAAIEWVRKLSLGAEFDVTAERLIDVALVIDTVYGWQSAAQATA